MTEAVDTKNLILQQAPGPTGFAIYQTAYNFTQDILQEFERLKRQYGNVVSLGWPVNRVLIYSPSGIKHIMRENHQNYLKSDTYEVIKPVLGNGLVTSEGTFWRRQRRLIMPEFKPDRIKYFSQIFIEEGQKALAELEFSNGAWKGDISPLFMKATFNIAGRTFFGLELDEKSQVVSRSITIATEIAIKRLFSVFPIYKYLPCPSNFKFNAAVKALDKIVYDLIDHFKANPGSEGLMARLLTAKDPESGESMSEQQVRDEVMTLLLAGHETTANTLNWTVYLLATNPAKQERLRQELQQVLQGRTPSTEDLAKLPYLNWCLKESMRVLPAVPMIAKTNIKDDVIDGFHIPAGSTIMMPQFTVHRSRELFSEPEKYEPERWSPERADEIISYSFFPFAEGPRKCIGYEFATIESCLILAMFFQKFKVSIQPDFKPQLFPNITLQSRNGMQVILEKV